MIIHFNNDIIVDILSDTFGNFIETFPNEFAMIEQQDVEIGDKYIDGSIVKPNVFYASQIGEDNLEFVKQFDEIDDEKYHKITKEEYEGYTTSGKKYIWKDGKIEEFIYVEPITKDDKFALLEEWYREQRSGVVEYNGKHYAIDEEAESILSKAFANVTNQFTKELYYGNSVFNTWKSHKDYQDKEEDIHITSDEEFYPFYQTLLIAMETARAKYINYKSAIEKANTQEELDNIVFE